MKMTSFSAYYFWLTRDDKIFSFSVFYSLILCVTSECETLYTKCSILVLWHMREVRYKAVLFSCTCNIYW